MPNTLADTILETSRLASSRERSEIGNALLRQHVIRTATATIRDSGGGFGLPYIALHTLQRLARNGTITPQQHAAGDDFHGRFRRACLDPLKAAPMLRLAASTRRPDEPVNCEAARRSIATRIAALGGSLATFLADGVECRASGPKLASAAWHILGLEWSIRQWAQRATRANEEAACGILVATLDFLERKFPA